MRGGFQILLSSFPSDCRLCSDISILSNFSVPGPDHLQKVPRRAAHSPSVRVQCASAFSEEIGMKGGPCLRWAHHCPPLLAPLHFPTWAGGGGGRQPVGFLPRKPQSSAGTLRDKPVIDCPLESSGPCLSCSRDVSPLEQRL